MSVSKQEIDHIAEKVVASIRSEDKKAAIQTLKPILDTKCPFAKLDILGKRIGTSATETAHGFFDVLDAVIDYNAMGSFVIVGQALIHFLPEHFDLVMKKSKDYIVQGDAWYVCDIIGERSIGHALMTYFERTLPWLQIYLEDDNRWVNRSAGVAIHFFSKRVLDEPEKTRILLTLVEPYMERTQKDFVKGVGWGLKTMGKHHPDILVEFLKSQVLHKKVSRLMLRKALTYLEENKKNEILDLV